MAEQPTVSGIGRQSAATAPPQRGAETARCRRALNARLVRHRNATKDRSALRCPDKGAETVEADMTLVASPRVSVRVMGKE